MKSIYTKLAQEEIDEGCTSSDLIRQAAREFSSDHHPELIQLIRSPIPVVRWRGLAVVVEIGRKCFPILDEVIAAVEKGSDADKADVLDAMLSSTKSLSGNHIRFVLDAAGSSHRLVRIRVMHIVRLLPPERTRQLVKEIENVDKRETHLAGLKILENSKLTMRELLEAYLGDNKGIVSLYCGAAMIAAAERGAKKDTGNIGFIDRELKYIFHFVGTL